MKKAELEKMGTEELEQILAAARQILEERRAPQERDTPQAADTREVLERRKGSKGGWLRTEMAKCGKPSCKKCSEGEGHGPYLYRYFTNPKTGKYTSEYIGKTLPPELAEEFGEECE
jgi:hypothetical protein